MQRDVTDIPKICYSEWSIFRKWCTGFLNPVHFFPKKKCHTFFPKVKYSEIAGGTKKNFLTFMIKAPCTSFGGKLLPAGQFRNMEPSQCRKWLRLGDQCKDHGFGNTAYKLAYKLNDKSLNFLRLN